MVVTPHDGATLAGLEALRAGGSAVDAAIAVSAMLMVVTPHQCAPGGDAFWLMRPAGGSTVGLNASGRSPAAASLEELVGAGHQEVPPRSAYAVTIPGVIDGWIQAHQRYGIMELSRLLAPAITAAEQGIPMTPYLVRQFWLGDEVLRSRPETARIYRPSNRPLQVGELLRQPELGQTLRLLAQDPAIFYRGSLAKRIASAVQAEGGWLSAADLAGHTSEWLTPVSYCYRGWTIEEMPPNSQGITALIGLALAEAVSPPPKRLARLHTLIEAAKIAMVVRDEKLGDPHWMSCAAGQLLDLELINSLAGLISPTQAVSPASIRRKIGQSGPGSLAPKSGRGDTVHSAIIDANGLAVSMIQSLYYDFGCGITVPGTGILLQNRGYSFALEPDRVNSLAPRKRPRHTLAPALAHRDGQTRLIFGAMGGDAQAQLHMQMIQGLLDDQLDPATVTYRPRWFARPAGDDFEILVERRLRQANGLRQLGHKVIPVEPFDEAMGHEQIILVDHQRGVLIGAADPRSDGLALGY